MKLRFVCVAFLVIVSTLGFPTSAAQPPAAYAAGKIAVGVILLHGHGGTAKGAVVGPLMDMFSTDLGFHVLSLDLPQVTGTPGPQLAAAYAQHYPEVERRISQAIEFLDKDKGARTIYLAGFSMGARMTSAFLAKHPEASIAGYVSVSTPCRGPEPMDSNANLAQIKVPVLDIYGAASAVDVNCAAGRSGLVGERYKVQAVAGAPHNFSGYEGQLKQAVADWVRGLGAK